MSASQYLYRRSSGTYFVRFCVPARFRSAVGKGEVHRSTGCRDIRLAKIVLFELARQWHEALEKLEKMDLSKVMAGSVELLGEGTMPLSAAAQALGMAPAALLSELEVQRAPVLVDAHDWQGWLIEDVEQIEHTYDEFGLQELVIDERQLDRIGTRRRLSQTLSFYVPREVYREVREGLPARSCVFLRWPSREKAFVVPFPGQDVRLAALLIRKSDVEVFRASLAERVTPEMIEAAERQNRPMAHDSWDHQICQPRHAKMKLSELVSMYVENKRAAWKPNTLHTNLDRCNALVELTGDPELHRVERTMLLEWTKQLKSIPADRHKVRARDPNIKSFRQVIDYAVEHNLPLLTAGAVERMIGGVSDFFGWARTNGYFRENPALGLGSSTRQAMEGRRKVVRKSEERYLFSAPELTTIFGAQWYREGVGQRTKEGVFFAYRPYQYWLPLLALFTGGRINELAQVYLDDLHFTDSPIPYVDFNLDGPDKVDVDEADATATDKSLKSNASERVIPLHRTLIGLGLEGYVAALRHAGHTRLFPELSHDRIKGYGKAAGKWFNDQFLGRQLKIERNGKKTFHSLRHHFATALGRTHTPTKIKMQLMGHSPGKELVDQRYDKGRELAELAPWIDLLEHRLPSVARFAVAEGLEAVENAIKLKASHRSSE